MLEVLIKLANHLDQLGHKDLADRLDAALSKTADWADPFREIMDLLPSDADIENGDEQQPDESEEVEELFDASFAADSPAIKKEASSSLDLSTLFVSESSFYGS
jgi:hypothetical protein